jgi:hypothetical protein
MSYSLAEPPLRSSFDAATKEELRAYAKWFRDVMPDRLRILENAVASTPGFTEWEATTGPGTLPLLGRWCLTKVSTRKRTQGEMKVLRRAFDIDHSEEELTDETISIATDVGMYLGQVVIANLPGTTWGQDLSSKRSIDYGQPGVKGFGKEALNPVRMCITSFYGMVSGLRSANDLMEIYDIWARKPRA